MTDIRFNASIPNNGFRLADKWDGEWIRTCLDFLETGDIFRQVNQDKTLKDGKVLRVVKPLKLEIARDYKSVDSHATKRVYLGGAMIFEEVENQKDY